MHTHSSIQTPVYAPSLPHSIYLRYPLLLPPPQIIPQLGQSMTILSSQTPLYLTDLPSKLTPLLKMMESLLIYDYYFLSKFSIFGFSIASHQKSAHIKLCWMKRCWIKHRIREGFKDHIKQPSSQASILPTLPPRFSLPI